MWNFGRRNDKMTSLADTWRLAGLKMLEMLQYDFPGVPSEMANKIVREIKKHVVSHTQSGEPTYVYFVGIGSIQPRFDIRVAKKLCWIPKTRLA